MEVATRAGATPRPRAPAGFLASIPRAVWLVAALAALLHTAPVWHAQSQTPPGWTFTGNLNSSPDFMQYRAWPRQAQRAGVLIANAFTSEPNRPHLPVFFYYAVGKVSQWTHWQPEFVLAYAGTAFAFGLTVLLFAVACQFSRSPRQTWWVFLTILIGGGLGAHLKLLSQLAVVKENLVLERLLAEPLRAGSLFEDFRDHYVFATLFDTHFLLIWLITAAAVLSLYFTLRTFSPWRLVLTASLYAAATLLHLYEGVTLMAITGAVTLLCWRKGIAIRPALASSAACALAVTMCLLWLAFLQRESGLPPPPWQGLNVLVSSLLLAYPLGWALIAWGLPGYWRGAGLDECFLLGWVLGCTALALSGPFYPYPHRSILTLQIPIYLVAGAIYFARHDHVSWRAALVAILILGATPAFVLRNRWVNSGFDVNATHRFLNVAHREIVDLLSREAREGDLLAADPKDVLWLAPEYRGTHYCGHFFLTVDYERKCGELARFFDGEPAEQAAFLQREGVRFLYVDAGRDPRRFARVPGLVLLKEAPVGSLFEHGAGALRDSR